MSTWSRQRPQRKKHQIFRLRFLAMKCLRRVYRNNALAFFQNWCGCRGLTEHGFCEWLWDTYRIPQSPVSTRAAVCGYVDLPDICVGQL